jgi:tetratricopeptide (TPR) repeat protein
LAEVYQRQGRIGEALIALDESICLSDEIGERLFTPEMYRLKGELLLQDGARAGNHRDARAREALEAALSVAHKQKAKLWELRTAASLARFWKARGERERARRLLEDGCRPFRKDLEIVDLRQARELLNGLSGD